MKYRLLLAATAVATALVSIAGCEDDSTGGGSTPSLEAGGDAIVGIDSAGGADTGPSGTDAGMDAPVTTDSGTDAGFDAAPAPPIVLTSQAWNAGQAIPAIHTCTGVGIADQSPPLVWTGAPAAAQSYAIVMRDTTLAGSNYHWVIYDLPGTTTALSAGVQRQAAPNAPPEAVGAKQTHWSFGATSSYLGPCPPVDQGNHTYVFTVYAFATPTIPVPANTTDPVAADAIIQANKIAQGSLSGTYQRIGNNR